jgi:hypothetical protein
MTEIENIIRQRIVGLACLCELRKMQVRKTEAQHIYRIYFVYAIVQAVVLAIATIHFLPVAVCVAGNAKL